MAQVEPIRRAMRQQPFRPFAVQLVDGTVYTVQHPDWLFLPPVRRPRELTYYAVGDDGGDDYETHWIDLALILEVIVPGGPPAASPAPSAESNGA